MATSLIASGGGNTTFAAVRPLMCRTAVGAWARKRGVEIVAAVRTERDFQTSILCDFFCWRGAYL